MANSGGPGDVADPASWNRYAYVAGDPINYYDPSGRYRQKPSPVPVGVDFPSGQNALPTLDVAAGDLLGAPSVPVGSGFNPYYSDTSGAIQTILNAERRAGDFLFDSGCAGLFLAPTDNTATNRATLSAQLDILGDAGLIRQIDPQNLPGGGSPSIPGFTTGTDGIIYIVSGGAFFSGKVNGNPIGGFASGMSLADFQALVIIHEFLHWDGMVGPDSAGQKYTLPNGDTVKGSDGISQEVKKKCLH